MVRTRRARPLMTHRYRDIRPTITWGNPFVLQSLEQGSRKQDTTKYHRRSCVSLLSSQREGKQGPLVRGTKETLFDVDGATFCQTI